jgi:hypothetical protein
MHRLGGQLETFARKTCVMLASKLASYLYDGGHSQVEGWLQEEAALTAVLISHWQRQQQISGGIAEIGVHHGRFFILLCLLRQDFEPAVAIDVFDMQEFNVDGSGNGDKRIFFENIERNIGQIEGLRVIAQDSLKLAGSRLSEDHEERFRLFSIDGSHTAKHTRNDIEVAFDNLCDGGLIIVDDFYNPDWPGVQEGVHGLLRDRREISAVAYGHNKLYLCQNRDWEDYFSFFTTHLGTYISYAKQVTIHDRPALHFSIKSSWRELLDRSFQRNYIIGNFGEYGSEHVELISGWSRSEPSGTWMSRDRASAILKLPSEFVETNTTGVRGMISVAPFVHPQRLTRPFSMTIDGIEVLTGLTLTGMQFPNFHLEAGRVRERMRVEFSTDEAESPARFLGSLDDRPLSVFIGEFRIDAV